MHYGSGLNVASLALVFTACLLSGQNGHAEATAETLAWAFQVGGPDLDYVTTVAPFSDGSLAIVGEADGSFYLSTPPEPQPYAAGVFVAKYNPRRQLVWMRRVSPASVFNEPSAVADALPDGTLFVVMEYFGEVTLGEGEPSEVTFPGPSSPSSAGSVVAAFAPDGSLKWASAALPLQTGGVTSDAISVAPDGTCYVCYAGVFGGTFAVGAPEQISSTGANNRFFACYSSEGRLQWLKEAETNTGQGIAAFDNCCVLLHSYPVIMTVYSPSGTVLSNTSYDYHHIRRTPGTRSFVAYREEAFAKFNVSQNGILTRQWTRPVPTDDHYRMITGLGMWPDGHGIMQTRFGTELVEYLAFSPDGTAGSPMNSNLRSNNFCTAPAARFPEYYLAGQFSIPLIAGDGQPGETTLTCRGYADGYVALYGKEAGFWIDTRSIGRGQIRLDPFLPAYPSGTVVTATAEPTFYDHDRFVRWEGYFAGNTNHELTFTVEQDMELIAEFEERPGAAPLPSASIGGLAILAALLFGIGVKRG